MDEEELQTFAEQYTSAWNSHNPEKVASLFEEGGSLSLDGRSESVGREEWSLSADNRIARAASTTT